MKKHIANIAIFVLMMCLPLVLVGCSDRQPGSTAQFSEAETAAIVAEFRTNFANEFGIEFTEENLFAVENEQGELVVTIDLDTKFEENRISDCVLLAMENLQIDYPNFTYNLELDEPFAYVYIVKT